MNPEIKLKSQAKLHQIKGRDRQNIKSQSIMRHKIRKNKLQNEQINLDKFNLNPVIQNLLGSIDPNQAFNLPISSLERQYIGLCFDWSS